MVVQKQQQSDLRGLERNKKKGLASWIHCDKCDQNIDAVVYPDGYMPGKRRQDKSKATPELIKRMEGTGPRANAAEVDSDDASSVAGSDLSVLEETAQLTKARLEAQQAQIAAMEASAEAREKRIDEMAQQLESMSDAEQAHDVPQRSQRSVKGRGIGSYRSSRLRMDEDDDGGDE
jgi:type II secretory pathway component HofQ